MRINNILFVCLAIVTFPSCEDVIDLELDSGKNQLVVDGFLNSEDSIQTIRLTSSAAYFSNVATPANNSATVSVIGPNNTRYDFISDGNGNYNYDTTLLGSLNSIGFEYTLEINYENSIYKSTAVLNPVPKIDSMPYDYELASGFDAEEGYYTQFYATDFAGRKDYYWIKPFKQGEPIDSIRPPRKPVYEYDPAFMILSEDATFGGEAGDGLPFIEPFRAIITDEENPFKKNQISSVELHSLNKGAYDFLFQLVNTSGNDGLFAVPPSNIRSNITDAAGDSQDEVLGVFSIASISKFEVVIQ